MDRPGIPGPPNQQQPSIPSRLSAEAFYNPSSRPICGQLTSTGRPNARLPWRKLRCKRRKRPQPRSVGRHFECELAANRKGAVNPKKRSGASRPVNERPSTKPNRSAPECTGTSPGGLRRSATASANAPAQTRPLALPAAALRRDQSGLRRSSSASTRHALSLPQTARADC